MKKSSYQNSRLLYRKRSVVSQHDRLEHSNADLFPFSIYNRDYNSYYLSAVKLDFNNKQFVKSTISSTSNEMLFS